MTELERVAELEEERLGKCTEDGAGHEFCGICPLHNEARVKCGCSKIKEVE